MILISTWLCNAMFGSRRHAHVNISWQFFFFFIIIDSHTRWRCVVPYSRTPNRHWGHVTKHWQYTIGTSIVHLNMHYTLYCVRCRRARCATLRVSLQKLYTNVFCANRSLAHRSSKSDELAITANKTGVARHPPNRRTCYQDRHQRFKYGALSPPSLPPLPPSAPSPPPSPVRSCPRS